MCVDVHLVSESGSVVDMYVWMSEHDLVSTWCVWAVVVFLWCWGYECGGVHVWCVHVFVLCMGISI